MMQHITLILCIWKLKLNFKETLSTKLNKCPSHCNINETQQRKFTDKILTEKVHHGIQYWTQYVGWVQTFLIKTIHFAFCILSKNLFDLKNNWNTSAFPVLNCLECLSDQMSERWSTSSVQIYLHLECPSAFWVPFKYLPSQKGLQHYWKWRPSWLYRMFLKTLHNTYFITLFSDCFLRNKKKIKFRKLHMIDSRAIVSLKL